LRISEAGVNELQKEAYICKRAYELAGSGAHIEPITVISTLIREGFPEAEEILGDERVRDDLHLVCAQSWGGATHAAHMR
jgi:hypothetical protein